MLEQRLDDTLLFLSIVFSGIFIGFFVIVGIVLWIYNKLK